MYPMSDHTSGPGSTLINPDTHYAHATPDTCRKVPGRREFLEFRDLGVESASGGRMRAQMLSVVPGAKVPKLTGWHYHTCQSQIVHVLKGWMDLEYEDGRRLLVKAGDTLFTPGGMRHNELAISDDLELFEIFVPAEVGTQLCDPPEWARDRA
jgi:quercetin dioxygenase-like cupin family protein